MGGPLRFSLEFPKILGQGKSCGAAREYVNVLALRARCTCKRTRARIQCAAFLLKLGIYCFMALPCPQCQSKNRISPAPRG